MDGRRIYQLAQVPLFCGMCVCELGLASAAHSQDTPYTPDAQDASCTPDAQDAPHTPDAQDAPETQEGEYTDSAAYAGDAGDASVRSARPARRETPSVGIQPVNSRFLHVLHLTSFATGATSV
jgi:hypothetical protein